MYHTKQLLVTYGSGNGNIEPVLKNAQAGMEQLIWDHTDLIVHHCMLPCFWRTQLASLPLLLLLHGHLERTKQTQFGEIWHTHYKPRCSLLKASVTLCGTVALLLHPKGTVKR